MTICATYLPKLYVIYLKNAVIFLCGQSTVDKSYSVLIRDSLPPAKKGYFRLQIMICLFFRVAEICHCFCWHSYVLEQDVCCVLYLTRNDLLNEHLVLFLLQVQLMSQYLDTRQTSL